VDFHRTVATVLLVAAAILASISINGPWWATSRVATSTVSYEQVQSLTLSFELNGSIGCSMFGWNPSPCLNVSSSFSGAYATFYGAIDDALYVLVAAGFAAAAFLGAGALGKSFGRLQFTLALAFAFAIAIAALGVTATSAVVGPGPDASNLCSLYSGNVTSCSSYWGGVTAGAIPGACLECSTNFGWGAGWSWYFTFFAGAGSLFAGYLLWRGRRGPFTQQEQAAWAVENRPFQLTSLPPAAPATAPTAAPIVPQRPAAPPAPTAPTGRSAIPFSAARTTRWACRRCRTVNSPWSNHCGACGSARPTDR
jgi:hypothetical protein